MDGKVKRRKYQWLRCLSAVNGSIVLVASAVAISSIMLASKEAINGNFIIGQLEAFSNQIIRPTFVVLDNARIHKTKEIQKRYEAWQRNGLYIFYLPPYSPHLNIAETLWRVMKGRWLQVKDYLSADTLFEATHKYLAEVGNKRSINYGSFNIN
jgi:transposase